MHSADVLFGMLAQRLPEYDYFVLLENDVYVRESEPAYFERLADSLRETGALDLAIVKLGVSDPVWIWHAAAARAYPKVWTSFFPLVVVSRRAAEYLLEERRREQARTPPEHRRPTGQGSEDRIVFCEAFIASALWAGGYKILDLNELLPGSYVDDRFNTGPPQLLGDPALDAGADLSHPVLSDREFLDKHLYFSWRTRTLQPFLERLRDRAWPLPEALAAEYEAKVMEKLAEPEAPDWAK